MKNSCTFYIVRHGKTDWNAKGWIQGSADTHLTPEGEEQAHKVKDELKDIKFDLAFSSDLVRAHRTAEIIMLEKKLAITTSKMLRERSFGSFEGKHYSALDTFDRLISELDEESRNNFEYHDIETNGSMITRTITFIRETAITHPGKTILIVTHGNLMYEFLIKIGFGTHKNFVIDAIGNTAYFVLESDGVEFEIKKTERIIHPDPKVDSK